MNEDKEAYKLRLSKNIGDFQDKAAAKKLNAEKKPLSLIFPQKQTDNVKGNGSKTLSVIKKRIKRNKWKYHA